MVLRIGPTVLPQPNASSICLRFFWLSTYPGCRVVRPSMAEPFFLGDVRRHMHPPQVRDEAGVVVALVGAERQSSGRAWIDPVQHLDRRRSFAVAVGVRHLGLDRKAVAVLHQRIAPAALAFGEQPRVRVGDKKRASHSTTACRANLEVATNLRRRRREWGCLRHLVHPVRRFCCAGSYCVSGWWR